MERLAAPILVSMLHGGWRRWWRRAIVIAVSPTWTLVVKRALGVVMAIWLCVSVLLIEVIARTIAILGTPSWRTDLTRWWQIGALVTPIGYVAITAPIVGRSNWKRKYLFEVVR
jgi:hypothetical protein